MCWSCNGQCQLWAELAVSWPWVAGLGLALVWPLAGLALGRTGHGLEWSRAACPWSGLAIGWAGHGLGWPWAGLAMGWTYHGLAGPWSELAVGWQDIGWSGNCLSWTLAIMAIVWAGHWLVIGLDCHVLAMGLAPCWLVYPSAGQRLG
jgi:hypothetical protein